MVLSDFGRGFLVLGLIFVGDLISLFVVSFFLEVFTLIRQPAREASIPNLVADDQLVAANSLSLVSAYGTFPIGSLGWTLLSQLGEPYFTTRARSRSAEAAGAHMGLGLFIARTLLAHSGAEVAFANRRGSPGAVVTIRWPEGIVAANANPDEGP